MAKDREWRKKALAPRRMSRKRVHQDNRILLATIYRAIQEKLCHQYLSEKMRKQRRKQMKEKKRMEEKQENLIKSRGLRFVSRRKHVDAGKKKKKSSSLHKKAKGKRDFRKALSAINQQNHRALQKNFYNPTGAESDPLRKQSDPSSATPCLPSLSSHCLLLPLRLLHVAPSRWQESIGH